MKDICLDCGGFFDTDLDTPVQDYCDDCTEVARCSICERATWDKKDLSKICNMIQPNGERCEGVFKRSSDG